MRRQREDVHERGLGPLFNPPETRLYGEIDPKTSREAAREILESGEAQSDALLLVYLIEAHPGETMEFYGAMAARSLGGDAYRWRLKLGRRTGTLQEERAIHQRGDRDGMGLWWPGPAADSV